MNVVPWFLLLWIAIQFGARIYELVYVDDEPVARAADVVLLVWYVFAARWVWVQMW